MSEPGAQRQRTEANERLRGAVDELLGRCQNYKSEANLNRKEILRRLREAIREDT